MENLEQQLSENLLTTFRHETQSPNSVREYVDAIPVDLLIEIFSRVPAKSIARFRCVSKFWESILRRPDFTELFVSNSLTRPRLLFSPMKRDGELYYYSTTQPQNPNDNASLVAIPYRRPMPKYISYGCIYPPVRGLHMLHGGRRNKLMICNPVTGEFLTLPKFTISRRAYTEAKATTAGMYFGYDPIGKQLKVLCMTSSRDERPNTHLVLTLETGKLVWRRIQHEFHFVTNGRIGGQICINGVLYFGAVFGRSSVIVCFDVRSEKLGFINTVDDMSLGFSWICSSLKMFNYKGRVGIHDVEAIKETRELVLWVLEDAGTHKWSKHIYALSPLGKEIVKESRFVGMTCTGEIVFAGRSNPFYVFFYNSETNTFTRVEIQGLEEFKYTPIPTFLDYEENIEFIPHEDVKKLGIQAPPDGRHMSRTQISVLEEQKKETTKIEEDDKVEEEDASTAEPRKKKHKLRKNQT